MVPNTERWSVRLWWSASSQPVCIYTHDLLLLSFSNPLLHQCQQLWWNRHGLSWMHKRERQGRISTAKMFEISLRRTCSWGWESLKENFMNLKMGSGKKLWCRAGGDHERGKNNRMLFWRFRMKPELGSPPGWLYPWHPGNDGDGVHHINAHRAWGMMLRALNTVHEVNLTVTLEGREQQHQLHFISEESLVLKRKAICPRLHIYEAAEICVKFSSLWLQTPCS